MARKANLRLMVAAVTVVLIGAGSAWGIEVLEPGLTIETYASYSMTGIGTPMSMAFDSDGELYITQRGNNSIWRVSPDGNASEFVGGFNAIRNIVWAGGTDFGDYLYLVGSKETGAIYRIGVDGAVYSFATRYCASPLGLDRTGNYGGNLYTATSCQDHTYRINTAGSVSMFTSWPGWIDGGGPSDIAFDNASINYGGLMYVGCSYIESKAHVSGLFSLSQSGAATRFADDLVQVYRIDFSETQYFDGKMFVIGRQDFDDEYASVWRVEPDGSVVQFAITTLSAISDLIFGSDGAMYVSEYDEDAETIIISRILFEPRILAGLEIVGPGEVAEDSQGEYTAIAVYDDNSTRDVTDLAIWSVEPNDNCGIEAGWLTTEPIDLPEDVTITAQYSKGDVSESAQKQVSIFSICPSGSALDFDGIDDYVYCGNNDSLDMTDELTVSAWIKRPNFSTHGVVVGKNNGNSVTAGYGLFSYNQGFEFNFYSSQKWRRTTPRVAVTANQWHHVVGTFNGNSAYLYVDGVQRASLAYNGDIAIAAGYPVQIAYWRSQNTAYFKGSIEEVAIYNRALSAEEIQANMHIRLRGDEPGLVGYWDFHEGQGQIAHDVSGNGNDGFLGSDPYDIDDSDPEWVESDAPVGICTPLGVDIKPGSCPNPLNLASKGVLPVAVLGSADFDVNSIDPASIFLEGVPAIRSSYEDVSSPVTDSNECECSEEGGDGYLDLTLKFKTQQIVEELVNSGEELVKGQRLTLPLTGQLYDGTSVEGTDCVVLVGNVSKWLAAKRSDINADGKVDILDFAELASYWLESSEAK